MRALSVRAILRPGSAISRQEMAHTDELALGRRFEATAETGNAEPYAEYLRWASGLESIAAAKRARDRLLGGRGVPTSPRWRRSAASAPSAPEVCCIAGVGSAPTNAASSPIGRRCVTPSAGVALARRGSPAMG